MKNSVFVLFITLVLIQACNKEDERIPACENCNFTCLDMNETDVITNDCMNDWECVFKVIPQSKVDISENQGQINGDKIVFQMINDTQGDSGIADDEITDIVVFELDESQNSFSVQDSELEAMNVHFRRVCYCNETEFKAVTSGCIQGEKQLDGTWFVQSKLNVPFSGRIIEVKFDAQFVE